MRRLHAYIDRNSIRFQLFRLVVLIATAMLLISLAGGVMFEWNNLQKQVRQSLETVARATGVAASAAIAFHDRTAAAEALRILATQKEIEAAALYPAEGYRLASYGDDSRLPDNIDTLREHQPGFTLLSPSTTLLQSIQLDDSTIGYIFIRAGLRDYHRTFLLQAALAIGANLLGLLLVLGFGLRLLDRIVQPVKELADTSRQVRENRDFSLRATAPAASAARDEIGELVLSFNAMLAEIELRQHELTSYHDSLEQMVMERTQALQAANQELQTAKEVAEAATVSKSRFLAAASHDLRQPMQALSIFHDLLREEIQGSDLGGKLLAKAQQAADAMNTLLESLLNVSKLDANVIKPDCHSFPVQSLLDGMVREFMPLAEQNGNALRIMPCSAIIVSDPVLLAQVLRNLVSNAIRYAPTGRVLVGCRRRKGQLSIDVFDTGIGISPDQHKAIFTEFYQVSNKSRNRHQGVGLGLAIVERVARLLGHPLTLRSKLGKGSCFSVAVPLDKAVGEPALLQPETENVQVMGNLAGCHILMIDDDEDICTGMCALLQRWGCRVTTALSVEEALAQVDSGELAIDAVISDMGLPGTDSGIDAIAALRLRYGNDLPALLVTGDTSLAALQAAMKAKLMMLHKPIKPARLRAALTEAIETNLYDGIDH